MITNKNLQEFKENGFIIIRNLISKKQITTIKIQINEILNFVLKKNNIKFKEKDSIDKKYLILTKNNPKLKSHFYDTIKLMSSIGSIVYSKKITNIMSSILKNKNIFINGLRVRLDHKLDQHNLPLHQELNNISNDFALMWAPLVNVNKKTGSLCLIPKSHKKGHLKYFQSNIAAEKHKIGIVEKIINGKEKFNYKNKIVNKLFKKKNLYFPNLKSGDAVIFTTFMFHGSTPYKGKGIRWSLLSSFIPYNKVPYLINKKIKHINISYDADYNKIKN